MWMQSLIYIRGEAIEKKKPIKFPEFSPCSVEDEFKVLFEPDNIDYNSYKAKIQEIKRKRTQVKAFNIDAEDGKLNRSIDELTASSGSDDDDEDNMTIPGDESKKEKKKEEKKKAEA